MSEEQIDMMEESFRQRDQDEGPLGAMGATNMGGYIYHNTGIGLQCFVGGLLIVPGLIVTLFNGGFLGAAFGHMATTDTQTADSFLNFVTAHGPFELTAIVLAAGSGLKLGMSWLFTGGLSRGASMRKGGREAMPMMGTSMVLFFLAAMIEGMLSPTPAPYYLKAGVAVLSSVLLMLYLVVLGFPRRAPRAA